MNEMPWPGRFRKNSPTTAAPVMGFCAGLGMLPLVLLIGCVLLIIPPIGIGVIIAAFLVPFIGLRLRRGACPNCGTSLNRLGSKGKRCRCCAHQIAMIDGRLVDYSE